MANNLLQILKRMCFYFVRLDFKIRFSLDLYKPNYLIKKALKIVEKVEMIQSHSNFLVMKPIVSVINSVKYYPMIIHLFGFTFSLILSMDSINVQYKQLMILVMKDHHFLSHVNLVPFDPIINFIRMFHLIIKSFKLPLDLLDKYQIV
jgi:hypothetical protein